MIRRGVGVGVLLATVAAAVYVARIKVTDLVAWEGVILYPVERAPWWTDPLAGVIGVCGVALGIAILTGRVVGKAS